MKNIIKKFFSRPSRTELVDEILRLRSQNFDLAHKLEEFQMLEKILADKLKLWVDKHDALLLKYKEELSIKNNDNVKNERNA